jgi:GT2 family glycosyltransferase
MRYDAVIATLNRPEALRACLRQLELQSERPERVIVVDASDDHESVKSVALAGRDPSIEWVVVRAERRGLPNQRNQGLEHVRNPVTFMPDDDSLMHVQAAEEMMAGYRLDTAGVVAGVGGIESAQSPLGKGSVQKTRGQALKARLERPRSMIETRIAKKPFESFAHEAWARNEIPAWVDGDRFVLVESIGGYLLSLRTDLARERKFDETLAYGIGYALHEDMEMGLRLQRDGFLLIGARRAPIFHDVHPGKRAGGFNYGFCWLANYIYVCRRTFPSDSAILSEQLERFLKHKLRLYRTRALVRGSEYNRDIYDGAKTAWSIRHELSSSDPVELAATYRRACDRYLRHH